MGALFTFSVPQRWAIVFIGLERLGKQPFSLTDADTGEPYAWKLAANANSHNGLACTSTPHGIWLEWTRPPPAPSSPLFFTPSLLLCGGHRASCSTLFARHFAQIRRAIATGWAFKRDQYGVCAATCRMYYSDQVWLVGRHLFNASSGRDPLSVRRLVGPSGVGGREDGTLRAVAAPRPRGG